MRVSKKSAKDPKRDLEKIPGLVRIEKKQNLSNLKYQESLLISQIKDLDFKNSLLSDNLDLDFIETLIREKFLMGKKNALYLSKLFHILSIIILAFAATIGKFGALYWIGFSIFS